MVKKVIIVLGALALVAALGVVAAGAVSAQSPTPAAPQTAPATTPQAPTKGLFGWGRGFPFFGLRGGGSTNMFDAVAKALNLTPTQLFEQLHSGKTLDEIAKAQGVDLQAVQDALNAARTQSMKDAINQAVKDGKMTQEQADWLLQGLDKGFLGKGWGFGHKRGGMMFGFRGFNKGTQQTPTPQGSGTSM
jgi:hypothetical protein